MEDAIYYIYISPSILPMYPIRIHQTYSQKRNSIRTAFIGAYIIMGGFAYYFYTQGEVLIALVIVGVTIVDVFLLPFLLKIMTKSTNCPTCNATIKLDPPQEHQKTLLYTCEHCKVTWDSQLSRGSKTA